MEHRALVLAMLLLAGHAGSAWCAEMTVHNDLTADGRSDVLWRNADTGQLSVWPAANAAERAVVHVRGPAFSLASATPVAIGDNVYVGIQLVLRDSVSGAYFLAIFDSVRGAGWRAHQFSGCCDPGWKFIGIADFKNVGWGQPLLRNERDGRNALGSPGFTWYELSLDEITPVRTLAWNVAGLGDFDGDGHADILWHNPSTGQSTVWPGADASLRRALSTVVSRRWKPAAVADFDGDGRADIFWHNVDTGANVIWRSALSTTRLAVARLPKEWTLAATGDFDGDHRHDVFWRNTSTGANMIWNGARAGESRVLPRVTNMAWKVVP